MTTHDNNDHRSSRPRGDGGGGGGGGSSGGGPRAGRRGLVQSSFYSLDNRSTTFATKNGLLHACIEAYNEHHNLVIRPDDVWFAILTQLSVYVNANAELLRSLFVDHAGQRELHMEVELNGLDQGAMAFHMTKLLGSALKDPALQEWVLPAFSTTEKPDQTVASVIFMGTMQKYFTYSWGTRCGIPEVTLEGDAADWIEIAQRCSDRLGSGAFGPGAQQWYRVLRPVLRGFIETFRDPDGAAAHRFWRGIVDEHRPNGSGCTTYSGWITAFAFWDEKGQCLHDARYGGRSSSSSGTTRVALSRSEIPMGFTKTPVTLMDNGKRIRTEMMAGSVGMRLSKSMPGLGPESPMTPGRSGRQRWDGYDTIQPEIGWFMYCV